MQNDYLDTQILLPEDNLKILPGTTVSGQINFIPKLDLTVARLGFQVIMQLDGKLIQNSKNITHVIFLKNKKLRKDNLYAYDIKFNIFFPSSYSGKNANIIFKVETLVELNTRSYLHIRNEYLRKHK
ncbi:MAG: hypothetical protein AB8H03_24420, partial [Saprospiraceae bacterium]